MEALMAVTSVTLTIYDMMKAVERHAKITDIRLIYKKGGKVERKAPRCGAFDEWEEK